ncbi:MAG TPA: sigma-70 family RNA polymerase sigma factor [Promineifilum sp.]|nr:sigma-70 family RNA polymerase sigma factor [Promineifilum sp.]HRO91129.1 sigma-70 family RNA polymerase sigma factor [Promineifilum sp.]HRQ12452.1 sigma-70 family RNA polymerase sigma factor [Promineifilum sp.]
MNEETLIHQAQEGDIVAFNRLVVQHQELVFNVAYRIMGDPAVAEDVAQETFITAYQSLKSFRGGSFKSWLIRVATNRCYDELRRRKRRPQTSLDEIMDENESFAFLRSPNEGPEAHRQRVELALVIEHCLKGLPDDQRIVTVLGDVEGYDYQEIANITRVSLGTVKSRLSRARAKLRDCLQQFGGELLPSAYRLDTRES